MILQALNDYYLRKQASSDPKDRLPAFGLVEKEIPFILEIDTNGRLHNITDTRELQGKKKVAQRFLVTQPVKRTAGVASNLLWDTAEYVLGIDTKGKPERAAEQHATFRKRLKDLPEKAKANRGLQVTERYLDSIDMAALQAHSCWSEIMETNPVVSLRVVGDVELVCQHPDILYAPVDVPEGGEHKGLCLITGEQATIERIHPSVKGVWGAQSSGANIVSFNAEAFNSYGKLQGANAPLGSSVVFNYTTAINHLLDRNSRQRVQIGDTSTVFWADKEHQLENLVPDLFGESPKDDPDRGTEALKALYDATRTGKFAIGSPDDLFHILGLAPNAARISIRFWETATAKEIATRIEQHFQDLNIVRKPHEPEHMSLFRLLSGIAAQGKADNIPPNLGGDMARAIMEGLPYPNTLMNLAVQRCRAEQEVTYYRAAAIKAWLNRTIRRKNLNTTQPETEYTPMLDLTNTNSGYRLGRLFAALEKTQEDASPGLNATIRDRYYGAASSTPAAVFSTLLRLKNHHVGKLHPGQAVNRERLFGEIIGGLNEIPSHLPLPDQARFALGYYHQRQAFFTKPDKPTNDQPQ